MGLAIAGMIALVAVANRLHTQGSALFAGVWVVLGLSALLLALRSISRTDFGSAAAWAACAVPLFGIVVLLCLGLSFLLTASSPTDETGSPAYCLPLVLFLGCAFALLAAIKAMHAAGAESH